MSDEYNLMSKLAEPFDVSDIKFKPQAVKGNRALAVAYISSRAVMERLDAVLGIEGWQDSYEVLPNDSVVCRLSVKFGGEWVTKTDVGSQSEQADDGDRTKAAFSDALKRAAVKLGIGRYIYRLPMAWADYDPQRKQFTSLPQLPAWALPKGTRQATPAPAPVRQEQPEVKETPAPSAAPPAKSNAEVQKQSFVKLLRDCRTKVEVEAIGGTIAATKSLFNPQQLDELRREMGEAKRRAEGGAAEPAPGRVAQVAGEVLGATPVDQMPAPY